MNEQRRQILLICILLLFLTGFVLFMLHLERPEEGEPLEVTFFDVGKGDCILISTAEHTVMIDTGYEETSSKILKALKERGISSIDDLIVTHFDKDHAGGVPDIISGIEVERILSPDYEGAKKTYDAYVQAVEGWDGQELRLSEDYAFELGKVSFEIYPSELAYDSTEKNDNDMSLVVRLENGGEAFLFMGDAEKDEIAAFLSKRPLRADVIKMPHHGKKEKNSDDLLDAVRPGKAVITDSAFDPAEEELLRLLSERGIEYHTTAGEGDIVINSGTR